MRYIGWVRPAGRDFWKPVAKGDSEAECRTLLDAELARTRGEGEWQVLPFNASPDAPNCSAATAADAVFAEARAMAGRLRPPPGKSLEERLGMR